MHDYAVSRVVPAAVGFKQTDLWNKTLGGIAPDGSASASGDISQMVKYLVANGAGASIGLDAFGATFPFTNGSTTDLTINGANQTVAPTNGVLRYRTLTFSTPHTLRITQTPCVLMVDTLVWNAAGVIACEASGAPSAGADPAEGFPRGGRAVATNAEAIGGYGGGFLIVLADTVNGSTTGTIRANGTAGTRNTTNGSGTQCIGGEGALDAIYTLRSTYGPTLTGIGPGDWVGNATAWGTGSAAAPPLVPAAMVLAPGGDSPAGTGNRGVAGGHGGAPTAGGTAAGGGSGAGGGGGANSNGSAAEAVPSRLVEPSLEHLLALYRMGCRGGGAGGAAVSTVGTRNGGGGGGGGCVVLVVDTETQVSTLTASGGSAAADATPSAVAGGSGVTLRQVI